MFELTIGLDDDHREADVDSSSETVLGRASGGPRVLLEWLETQLGCPHRREPSWQRTMRYLRAATGAELVFVRRSLTIEPWETARTLLARRDELRLAGWLGDAIPGSPLMTDLAAIEGAFVDADTSDIDSGVAARLDRVGAIIEAGATLPPHRIKLRDPLVDWPQRWRDTFASMNVSEARPARSLARAGSALARLQQRSSAAAIPVDDTIRYYTSLSTQLATQAIAAAIASLSPDDVVVLCSQNDVREQLEAELAARGLPTWGSARSGAPSAHEQLLPLAIQLLFEPVDPRHLVEFLSLSCCPVPRRTRRRLLHALTEQPGLESSAWCAVVEALTDGDPGLDGGASRDDSASRAQARRAIATWFGDARFSHGSGLPIDAIERVCDRVRQFASRRLAILDAGERDPWQAIVHDASQLAELVAMQTADSTIPTPLSGPAIARRLESVRRDAGRSSSGGRRLHGPQLGAVRIVTSLADVRSPIRTLIWLGLGSRPLSPSKWSHRDLAALTRAGIELDDGRRELERRRRAESRGLSMVRESIHAVALPSDAEHKRHASWITIEQALNVAGVPWPRPLAIGARHAPPFDQQSTRTMDASRDVRRFMLSPETLVVRERNSASELQARLGCPLRWTLQYAAALRTSRLTELPDGPLLLGSFCHSVLASVFDTTRNAKGESKLDALLDASGALDVERVIEAVASQFDARIAFDAAPLAIPSQAYERLRLRDQLIAATRTFVDRLNGAAMLPVAMELHFDRDVGGRQLFGYIDCLAATRTGDEAIVDFKFGSSKKYRQFLADGRATQLATYAAARAKDGTETKAFPRIAYLILSTQEWHTLAPNALPGSPPRAIVAGAPIGEVWQRFDDALANNDSWRSTGDIPVRPLEPSIDWPDGVDIVLDREARDRDNEQELCRYCDYGLICGQRLVK